MNFTYIQTKIPWPHIYSPYPKLDIAFSKKVNLALKNTGFVPTFSNRAASMVVPYLFLLLVTQINKSKYSGEVGGLQPAAN